MTAAAAEWSATPSVYSQIFYDDNYQLYTGMKDAVTGLLLEPRLLLARRTETTNLQLNSGVQFRRFPSTASLNTNDRDLTFTGSYLTQRSRWGLTAGLVRDTTVTSSNGDEGLVQTAYGRHRKYIAPSWSWSPSQRSRVDLSLNDTLVTYNAPASQFSSYKYLQVNGIWTWQYTALTQLQAMMNGTRYKASSTGLRSNSWGLQVGAIHQFSERLTGSLNVGQQVSLTTVNYFGPIFYPCSYGLCVSYGFTQEHSRSTGLTVATSLTWKDLLDTYRLSATRTVIPTGLGQLAESDTVQASIDRQLKEHLAATLRLYALRSRALPGAQSTATFANRTYVDLSPGLRWQLTRYLWLRASYGFRRQKIENQAAATSSRIIFGLRYTWPKLAMSR